MDLKMGESKLQRIVKMGQEQEKKPYNFGGIEIFDLAQIEHEVLNDSIYLDVFAGSDPLFKTNVEAMNTFDVAQSTLGLKTYKFDYKLNEFRDKKLATGTQIGLMADEVERAFPECVATDDEGYRYVNYSMMVVPLLETIKHLEVRVAQLEKKLSEK